ncbi:MAG: hypothetical protein K6F71_07695 [Ruminococcus sp.]|uniref:hypothetical protein n=1 Tax=Ruminococcus sp. TaxID=41978 RepID=UPI0025D5089A|nr:hypothetical protein [Ruminococcus sp.]MCR5540684.1 hypothetical protein [Ruminococcus sp.]
MIIGNEKFDIHAFNNDDVFIFSIGYEHRSCFLYNKIKSCISPEKIIVIAFDDYEKYPFVVDTINEITAKDGTVIINSYSDYENFHRKVIEEIVKKRTNDYSNKIHIDYSSMPRSWYCKLPILLKETLCKDDVLSFWYTEGEYPSSYEKYPSAGIDSFSLFSGTPSLRVDNKRIHILGLGYDIIRSQAILSITDPSFLVSCYAYNPSRTGFLDSIKSVNNPIFSRSAISIGFHIDDFKFMISKLCETANELLPSGDVILIPDGPKPLIFAMSLVTVLMENSGLTCLHISRNSKYFEIVDVESTGNVYGFSIHFTNYDDTQLVL